MSQLFPSFERRRAASPYLHIRPRSRHTGLKLFAAFIVGSVCTVALIRHQGLIVDRVAGSSPPKAATATAAVPAAPAAPIAPVASAPAKRNTLAPETAVKSDAAPVPAAAPATPASTPRSSRITAGERPAIATMPIGAPSTPIEPAPVLAKPKPPAAKTAATTPAGNEAQASAAPGEEAQPQAKPEPKPRVAKRARNRDRGGGDDAIETLVRVPGRVTPDGRPVYRRLRDNDDGRYALGPNNEITPLGGAGRYAGYGSRY